MFRFATMKGSSKFVLCGRICMCGLLLCLCQSSSRPANYRAQKIIAQLNKHEEPVIKVLKSVDRNQYKYHQPHNGDRLKMASWTLIWIYGHILFILFFSVSLN